MAPWPWPRLTRPTPSLDPSRADAFSTPERDLKETTGKIESLQYNKIDLTIQLTSTNYPLSVECPLKLCPQSLWIPNYRLTWALPDSASMFCNWANLHWACFWFCNLPPTLSFDLYSIHEPFLWILKKDIFSKHSWTHHHLRIVAQNFAFIIELRSCWYLSFLLESIQVIHKHIRGIWPETLCGKGGGEV